LDGFILSVNAIQANKNYPNLLKAYSILRNQYHISIPLVIVGRDGWGSEETHAFIKAADLGESVRCLGFIPAEHLKGLYSAASLVVNASTCEGFGLPILEALACGAEVAVAERSSFPEAGGAAVFYFNPENINSIAETIYDALTNSSARSAKLQLAASHLENFSWEKAARETLNCYRELAG
jgi:alpha-1,3-rhamnosyl/mannosyltransferase